MEKHKHNESENISIAIILNVVFTFIEFFGGLFTNSLAILSDALHDFGDSLVLILAWFAEKKSKKEANLKKTFGYKRVSLFSALLTSTILVAGSIFILIKAVPRLIHPEAVNSQVMIYIAIVGVICNGLGALKIREGKKISYKAISWHLLEDVLGWFVVLLGSIIINFFHKPIIDPIMTVAYTVFIIWGVTRNIHESINILMEGVPDHINVEEIKKDILKLSGVIGIHDIHVWSLDGESSFFTGHVVFNSIPVDIQKTKKIIKSELTKHHISHSTIELEDKDNCSGVDCR